MNYRKIDNILLTGALLAVMAGSVSCSKADTAGETEAAIQEARIDARESARIFLNRSWKDTVELKRKLLEVHDHRAKYDSTGRKESAQTYDTTFYSTLRTVRPEMAVYLTNAINERKTQGAQPVRTARPESKDVEKSKKK